MGEAKARGTFEQRKKEAIKRQEKEREERRLKRLEKELNKTPAQRKREQEIRKLYAEIFAMMDPYKSIFR